MGNNTMMMFEEEQAMIQGACDDLSKATNALAVLCIDKNGQEIARAGETEHLDVTSLSSLLAEKEFSGQFHEGEKTNVHISLVAQRAILVVLFDQRSSLGLVRLRVKKASEELSKVFDRVIAKMQAGNGAPSQVFGEITDDDIDNLFKD